jgi:hypothetical protein
VGVHVDSAGLNMKLVRGIVAGSVWFNFVYATLALSFISPHVPPITIIDINHSLFYISHSTQKEPIS